ncbi:MAG: transposase [Gemmatimonadota bacterium]|nr:transposase [Gammaproteobacteria bacterium]MDE2983097.1 transposase [Gemmatimonadota bacterium]
MSEPKRGRRKWKGKRDAQKATYGNRRRIKGERGKRLLRQRAEKLERTFAHLLGSGGMRCVHLHGREEIPKRVLLQAAAFNLGLLMRSRFGVGTPRSLQGLAAAAAALADASARSLAASIGQIRRVLGLLSLHTGSLRPSGRPSYNKTALTRPPPFTKPARWRATSSTAC